MVASGVCNHESCCRRRSGHVSVQIVTVSLRGVSEARGAVEPGGEGVIGRAAVGYIDRRARTDRCARGSNPEQPLAPESPCMQVLATHTGRYRYGRRPSKGDRKRVVEPVSGLHPPVWTRTGNNLRSDCLHLSRGHGQFGRPCIHLRDPRQWGGQLYRLYHFSREWRSIRSHDTQGVPHHEDALIDCI